MSFRTGGFANHRFTNLLARPYARVTDSGAGFALAAALTALWLSASLLATSVIPLAVESMAQRANRVVEGRATQVWSTWDAQ